MVQSVVELLAGAQHSDLSILSHALRRDHVCLSVVAREATRAGLVSGSQARKLVRLDEAAHWARHVTAERLQGFLAHLSAEVSQG